MLIAAATVIPLRDTSEGPEVLMLRKNSAVAFGGMWVFPGGRIDDDDVDPEHPGDEVHTARRAAAREAREEADLVVAASDMVTFSHWTPPEQSLHSAKRFSTWFFVCRAPGGVDGQVTIDGGEIHEDVWVRPGEMLDRSARGEIQLAPPTAVTLLDLVSGPDVDAILTMAAGREPFRYATRLGQVPEGMVTMWAGDAGYDLGDASTPGPRHRLVMGEERWRFECHG